MEDAAAERLGEPVLAAAMILPVGGWNSGLIGQLAKGLLGRLRGQAAPTTRLGRYSVVAVTEGRVVCFAAGFASGKGVVLRDQLAELPRDGLSVEAKRMDAVSGTYDPGMGTTTRTNSKRTHRLALAADGQRLHGDIGDDGAGRELLKALRGG
jgi:uncharacterized membrane protein YuzA (DUF378 family)